MCGTPRVPWRGSRDRPPLVRHRPGRFRGTPARAEAGYGTGSRGAGARHALGARPRPDTGPWAGARHGVWTSTWSASNPARPSTPDGAGPPAAVGPARGRAARGRRAGWLRCHRARRGTRREDVARRLLNHGQRALEPEDGVSGGLDRRKSALKREGAAR